MLLAGDIGGTKTNLAVFTRESGWRVPIAEATFPSAGYASLEELVREFVAQHDFPIDYASFGVARPVVGGGATITTLPLTMDDGERQMGLPNPTRALSKRPAAIA